MLTKALLISKKQLKNTLIKESGLISDFSKPYYLFIASINPKSTKITIYPILEKRIIKIIAINNNKNQNELQNFIQKISNSCDIIHTSGLVYTPKTLIYELYLPENKEDPQKIMPELKNNSGEKKNIIKFKYIKLEKKRKYIKFM